MNFNQTDEQSSSIEELFSKSKKEDKKQSSNKELKPKKLISPIRKDKIVELKGRRIASGKLKNNEQMIFESFNELTDVNLGFSINEYAYVRYPEEFKRDKKGNIIKDKKSGYPIPNTDAKLKSKQDIRRFNKYKKSTFELAAGIIPIDEKIGYSVYYAVPKRDRRKVIDPKIAKYEKGGVDWKGRVDRKYAMTPSEKKKNDVEMVQEIKTARQNKLVKLYNDDKKKKKKQSNNIQYS